MGEAEFFIEESEPVTDSGESVWALWGHRVISGSAQELQRILRIEPRQFISSQVAVLH
jgi:hypothetical protein